VGDVKTGVATPFARWGDWLSIVCLGISLVLVAVAWFRPIGARTGGGPWVFDRRADRRA